MICSGFPPCAATRELPYIAHMTGDKIRDWRGQISADNPIEAARRAVRPAPRRRFYERVETAALGSEGFAVRLDGKPIRTPAGGVLATPNRAVAEAIAAEWQAQRETIDPTRMPLTRLANSVIDGVREHPGAVAAEVRNYLASDLICYRAGGPERLIDRQSQHWDPIVQWAREALGARFALAQGVMHVAQSETALSAAGAKIPSDPWRLGAIHSLTTLSGSALIALAVLGGRLSIDEAWQAAHVDEDWNIQQWGHDEIALSRRAFRFAEFSAAATVLRLLET
jgi:chaperone required for assembly of F1-ATPase